MAAFLSVSSSASYIGHLKAVPSPSAASFLARHGFVHGSRGFVGKSGLHQEGTSVLVSSLRGTPLRSGDKHKAVTERRSGADVRASSIGVVKEVTLVSKEPLYYNVTLTVSPGSEVATWYTTPGQYLDLIPVNTQFSKGSTFFFSSPVRKLARDPAIEFLIEDVSNSVGNEIINSKPGDPIVITTNSYSTGFNLSALEDASSVLMFASSYGIGPFRALIETGFEANKRKDAILYAMYTPEQIPYESQFPTWEQTGVKVISGPVNDIIETDPATTVVLMVASTSEQEALATYFEKRGVPEDKILTLFSGIATSEKSFYNKVLHQLSHYPKFPHHAKKRVPVELRCE